MSGCESIRSLSELPPNLMKLDVSGCKSLQALPSNTCKLLHLNKLHFEECPQLDQTIPVEILANFLVHPSLSSSPQLMHREVVCSRSELPEWLTYKSMNMKKEEEDCTVEVDLPPIPDDTDQPIIIKGIAFAVVFASNYSWVEMKCDCKVGNTIVASWPSHISKVEGDNSSEILWLKLDKSSSGEMTMKSKEEAWYVKYASLTLPFHFYVQKNRKIKIKRCGVSLLY